MKVFTAVLASALFIAPAAMFAQTPTPGAHDYNINQRKVDQQDRIANGVKSGQLTAGETVAPGTPGSRHQPGRARYARAG